MTPCVCTTEAAVGTLTPFALKRVSLISEYHPFTDSSICVLMKRVLVGSSCDKNSPPSVARGDTFEETDEVTEAATTPIMATVTMQPTSDAAAVTSPASPPPPTAAGPTSAVDPDAAPCSGRAFDAFLQLKNGSIYAFRGTFLS